MTRAHVRNRRCAAAALLTAGVGLVVAAGPARAADDCQKFTVHPYSEVMASDTGPYPAIEPTFADDPCYDKLWTLSIPDLNVSFTSRTNYDGYIQFGSLGTKGDGPQEPNTVYLATKQAGSHDVIVSSGNGPSKTFKNAFTIKRTTYWKYVNAGPEPAKVGSTITVRGRLKIADWTTATNTTYGGRTVRVVFSPGRKEVDYSSKILTAKPVATGTTDSSGFVSIPVKVTAEGRWYLLATGSATASDNLPYRGDLVPLS